MRVHLRIGWLVLAVVVLGVGQVAAQGTQIKGKLANSLSRDVVGGATVTIDETRQQTRSAADGTYTFDSVAPGKYHVSVSANGYLPHRQEVTVSATQLTVDIDVDPELHYSEVVSVSPEARNQFESYQPTTVLAGQEFDKERQSTLGETLQNQPGISVRAFGSAPSRPVIRGLDGDRVLILEDGQRTGDLSSQSGDHGVNINPAGAKRVEVVRGPATLLYGSNAVGGLVNVITNDIPNAPVNGATGSFTFDAGTAAKDAGGNAEVTVGNGAVALHLSGGGRRADDYKTPEGRVPNSFLRGAQGEVGVGWTGEKGYVGLSYAYDRTHYGIPLVEEGNTNLNPRRNIVNFRAERREMDGFLNSFRASVGVRRYRHDERAGDEVATAFKNDTSEFEFVGNQRPAGKLKGSFGIWALGRAFEAAGEETLSPPVDQKGVAAFVYEEIVANPHVSFQFGGRVDHERFTPQEEFPNRSFTNFSGSVGLVVHPTDATSLAFSLARAARNPALEELYFHGPHPGNNAIENGDEDLGSERALGFDVSLRWRATKASGELTYFYNNINDFIFRRYSGRIIEDFAETFFTAGDARLQGVESHVDFSVTGMVFVEAGVDYVRGELTSAGKDLPRMPPLRGRLGLRFQKNAFQAGAEGVFTAKQEKVFEVLDRRGEDIGETPTPGSNILKLYASNSFTTGKATSTITARLDNATNALYRNHLNYLKDFVPEMGRSFRLLFSVKF